ncbi:MAG: hypothetical protein BWY04_00579 [candidate division CPR1 bacterium ADurb.Bin160]|uniref:Uncharacterized protein n=1 Tax=candidate division CPR1 bacterium ADurb.Bin160 TaxID=1852826 RepID=A0A1V5ZNP7_9BACT|nr:MAG: hypothetical protein BWY04_00579 [candidate division CPR1 bacterium ADurb.Bin160]
MVLIIEKSQLDLLFWNILILDVDTVGDNLSNELLTM